MKVLITGSGGFIGRNTVAELSRFPDSYELLRFDIDTPEALFEEYLKCCDFVVHLAGVNRPKSEDEFKTGNAGLTETMLARLEEYGNTVPVLMTSSIQSDLDNPYGKSKRDAENAVLGYGKRNSTPVYVYKLPNVFGKWCRPNYNSAVATFCYNTANELPITVNDREHPMTLIYIDDVLRLIKKALEGKATVGADGYGELETVYSASLGRIADTISGFKAMRDSLIMPNLSDGLTKALYSTYLSYLPTGGFSYTLTKHEDARGLFAEFFKSKEAGQFSISTTAPGITRGNHWHHTKVEKFLVICGEAAIRFRKLDSTEVIEYNVNASNPTVVDIPVGYTHSITNTSQDEYLVTAIWANEIFDPENPDTYYLEV